jgi:predicted alpha/beta-hydrolase family hydrolase
LRLVETHWFRSAIVWVFTLWALLSATAVFELVFSTGLKVGGARPGFGSDSVSHLNLINIASLCSTAVSAVLVVWGCASGGRATGSRRTASSIGPCSCRCS